MENLAKISCDLSPTNPSSNLQIEVWIDNNKIFDNYITEHRHIEYRISDDDEREHEIKFVLKNKTDADTIVDELGAIIKDSLINITNIKFDDIDLGYIVNQLSVYRHNHNGHSNWADEKFYGSMGCNGILTLKFTTPIYLWLLENM